MPIKMFLKTKRKWRWNCQGLVLLDPLSANRVRRLLPNPPKELDTSLSD
jgi:hypothetical protein